MCPRADVVARRVARVRGLGCTRSKIGTVKFVSISPVTPPPEFQLQVGVWSVVGVVPDTLGAVGPVVSTM